MALLGMALGVTSIVSVHLVSTSVSKRLDALVPERLSNYSHYLHKDRLKASDYFALRRQWQDGELPAIKQLSPIVDETTVINGANIRVLGIDLLANLSAPESSNNTGDFQNSTWNGVWIDKSLKDKISFPINGFIEAPEGTLLADISVAHDLLGWQPEQLSYVGLRFHDPFTDIKNTAEHLLPGFGAGFPSARPQLLLPTGWQLIGTAEQYPAREFGKSILFNISALGMLALLVAWLLIYQVAISWLRRLWPVFDRLHVLGVEWQQLRRYFLFSIGIVATSAAGLGLLLGWWLAKWLLTAAIPTGTTVLSLDAWVITKAVGSAIIVCLLGGMWAFRGAYQSASGNAKHATKTRRIAARSIPTMVTVTLLLVAVWCVFQPQSGLAGGFFAIAIMSLTSAQLVAPLLKQLRSLAAHIKGSYLIRIGIREALWHPKELSVAISGLSLAIATSIGVALMVDSFRFDFSQMLNHRLKYDVIAQGGAEDLNKLKKMTLEQDTQIRTQIFKETELRVNGILVSLNITNADIFETKRYGFNRALNDNEILLSEQASKVLNTHAGDTLAIERETVIVAGVFSAFGDLQPRLIAGNTSPLAARYNSDLSVTSIAFMSDNPKALISNLRGQFPNLELRLQSEIRRIALDTFDQTFAITKVLITIALLVAAISVYIAVTTLRLNRRTSTVLLNTLGTTRSEQLTMNLSLGAGLGLVAISIAIPLGLGFGWVLCNVINPRAFGWTIDLQLSTGAIFYSCCWGMLAAIFAGLLQSGSKEEGGIGGR